MTAVVRGSSGEPVILLSGNGRRGVSEETLLDMIKVAAVVLSEAELGVVSRAVPRLRAGRADSCVWVGGEVLTVYRLAAG
ncbi:hypothetical protein GCM10022206_13030 [Streptomyces chiangmaiensis]